MEHNISKAFIIVILAIFSNAVLANSNVGIEICKAPLIHAGKNFTHHYSYNEKEEYFYKKMCGSQEYEKDEEFKFAFDYISVFKFDIDNKDRRKSVKEWCNENKQYEHKVNETLRIEQRVYKPALDTFNSCIEAFKGDLQVNTQFSADNGLIKIQFENKDRADIKLTHIAIDNAISSFKTKETKKQPICTIDGKVPKLSGFRNIRLKPNIPLTIDCKRPIEELLTDDNNIVEGYTAAVISFTIKPTSGYILNLSDYANVEPPKNNIPQKTVFPITREPVISWVVQSISGGERPEISCGHDNIPKVKSTEDFELVSYGYEEKKFSEYSSVFKVPTNVRNAHLLPIYKKCMEKYNRENNTNYCLRFGDTCFSRHLTKGCWVNKKWHDWYKAETSSNGLSYSLEQICHNPQ